MARLEPFAPNLWIVSAPLSFLGMRIGTRMSVIRLGDGSLLLHSPVPVDDALAREIDALGPVKHIVAPNLFHHLHVGPALARWPEARSYAPAGLAKKRRDLRIDADLDERADLPFADELEPLSIRGCDLGETVLLHKPSKTVVSADLCENFKRSDHWPTRVYLKVSGVYGRPGWSRLLRFVYRDHALARSSVDRLLKWDFDKAVIAHGEPFTSGAKEAVEQTFVFLK